MKMPRHAIATPTIYRNSESIRKRIPLLRGKIEKTASNALLATQSGILYELRVRNFTFYRSDERIDDEPWLTQKRFAKAGDY